MLDSGTNQDAYTLTFGQFCPETDKLEVPNLMARIVLDKLCVVNSFAPNDPAQSSSKHSKFDNSREIITKKKRGERGQRGNCLIALAGGGNQSFLTDSRHIARGSGLTGDLYDVNVP